MLTLRQFIPKAFCLSCDGCCRYAGKDTSWSPLFLFEEILELTKKNILPCCLFSSKKASLRAAGRINVIEARDGFICPCLEVKSNKCKIYRYRPLDCRLYPFLLLRRGKKAYLAVDNNCVFIREGCDEKKLRAYAKYLLKMLSMKEFTLVLKKNPQIIQEYCGNIKILDDLPWNLNP